MVGVRTQRRFGTFRQRLPLNTTPYQEGLWPPKWPAFLHAPASPGWLRHSPWIRPGCDRAAEPSPATFCSRLYYTWVVSESLDLDLLDDVEPFEIAEQVAHLFKHPALGVDDVYDVWDSDPLFYPAAPPAHWLMVADVGQRVLVVPLTPSNSGDPRQCRPIGCYEASAGLATRYREDR